MSPEPAEDRFFRTNFEHRSYLKPGARRSRGIGLTGMPKSRPGGRAGSLPSVGRASYTGFILTWMLPPTIGIWVPGWSMSVDDVPTW